MCGVRVRVAGSRNGPERQEGLAAAGGSEGPGTVAAAVQELEGWEGLVVVWKHRRVQAHVGTVSTTDSSGQKHAHEGAVPAEGGGGDLLEC